MTPYYGARLVIDIQHMPKSWDNNVVTASSIIHLLQKMTGNVYNQSLSYPFS